MKHTLGLSVFFLLAGTAAQAIDLNTDALKTMQQQGHEIVEKAESQDWRSFRLEGGQCLQIAGAVDKVGANVVLRDCNASAKVQQFSFDDQGRLVSHGGTCLGVGGDANQPGANALMQKCGGQNFQKWRLDPQSRLHNQLNKCLHAAGAPGQPTGNVISQNCSANANQVWK